MSLIKGERLCLRQATPSDTDFIMHLTYAEENIKYIVPFPREKHEAIIAEANDAMDIIVETIATGESVGYLMVEGLTEFEGVSFDWVHVIIDKKGLGYGHEALKLLKAWSFKIKKAHRVWLDCKEYNHRALHLYESEGLKREGIIRETIVTNGVFENLIVLAILEQEYEERCKQGLELNGSGI